MNKKYTLAEAMGIIGIRTHKLPFGNNDQHPDYLHLRQAITDHLTKSIETGKVWHFICGMSIGADLICADRIIALKSKYPHIQLEAALAFKGQENQWTPRSKTQFCNLVEQCDSVHYINHHFSDTCYFDRNRYIVNNCGSLTAIWGGQRGGTAYTVRYARKLRRKIYIINPATGEINIENSLSKNPFS